MTKKANTPSTAGSSSVKPLAILVIGLVAAVAVALFLLQNTTEQEAALELDSAELADSGASRIRGPESATVTLLEYGDYQCPTCATFHPLVSQLMARFPNDLQFEFHHFPLMSIHPNALYAAVAAEAAGDQGAFWEMHDLLFERQNEWAARPDPQSVFTGYAADLGLDRTAFAAAMQADGPRDRITEDLGRAQQLRLSGTPSFFVNGQPIPLPRSYGEFESYIVTAIQTTQ